MKNFALLGVAGYVAPRHLKAIHETGNRVVAVSDPSDSVGILDRYFFETRYFREYERFDRHIESLRRRGDDERVHYLSVCSPNYLHDAHIRLGLRAGVDVICEKPLVINPWNLDRLAELEAEYGKRVFTVLQLRNHPDLIALHRELSAPAGGARRNVVLTYVTARGRWYLNSWKGDEARSGGLATNIGIHFFDLLIWLFGAVDRAEVHHRDPLRISGSLELERASVTWYLSIDRDDLPAEAKLAGRTTHRAITIDGTEVEFSEGFADLHTVVYRHALEGRGFGLQDARPSIRLTHDIRTAPVAGIGVRSHPLTRARG